MTLIIGNIIALIASILMIIISCLKTKKEIIITQTIQITLLAISSFILGGITGAIINLITIIRNILCYKNKLNKTNIFLIITLLVLTTILFNNINLLGFLPLISTIIYTIFINTKSTIKLKILILLNMICWGIYDFCIMSYTSAIFEAISTITSLISLRQLLKNKKIDYKNIFFKIKRPLLEKNINNKDLSIVET